MGNTKRTCTANPVPCGCWRGPGEAGDHHRGRRAGDRRARRGLPHGVGRRDVPPVHEGPPADGEPRGHRAQAHGAGRLRRPLPRQRRVRPGQRGRGGGPWRHRRAWYKHRTAASRTVAIGAPRDEPAGAVLAGDAAVRGAMMSDIVAELGRCLVPVRPARACDRDGPGGKRANRHGDTHKRAFWRPQVLGKRPQVARHALRAKAAQTVMSGRPTSGVLPM